MKLNKKEICFVVGGSLEMNMKMNTLLYEHFSNTFEKVFFLDVNKVFTTALEPLSSANNSKMYAKLPPNFEVVVPKNLSEFKRFLKSNNLVVICFFSETWKDWYIHYYLRKYSIPLVYILSIAVLVIFSYRKVPFARILNKFSSRYLSLKIFRMLVLRGLLSRVDTFFVSQKADKERLKRLRGYNEVIEINSRAYDSFLINQYKTSNDYLVFLDSMLPYHGDQVKYGFMLIDRGLYYKNLNRVLDIMERITGKEAVVCLHPAYNEDNLEEDLGKRRTAKFKTDYFIAQAELVLFHASSAINSAILYNKKVTQLLGSKFNDFVKKNCEAYQNLFSFSTLDIYESSEEDIKRHIEALRIDRECYDKFLDDYIIVSGQKDIPSHAQIADHMSRKYEILKK
ncbi:MAG: hypothetical protein ACYSSI_13935 [Planctomycetota bacterium]|jgi:hypothetical protein